MNRQGRSPEFLTGSWQYTLALFTAAARINMLPQWLRPLAAPWLMSDTKKHFAQCLKAAEPVIKKRLAEVQAQKGNGSSSPPAENPVRSPTRRAPRSLLPDADEIPTVERRLAMGH